MASRSDSGIAVGVGAGAASSIVLIDWSIGRSACDDGVWRENVGLRALVVVLWCWMIGRSIVKCLGG